MLYSTFFTLLTGLGSRSLNEDWYIYKIVTPVILIVVVVLALIKFPCQGKNHPYTVCF